MKQLQGSQGKLKTYQQKSTHTGSYYYDKRTGRRFETESKSQNKV